MAVRLCPKPLSGLRERVQIARKTDTTRDREILSTDDRYNRTTTRNTTLRRRIRRWLRDPRGWCAKWRGRDLARVASQACWQGC